MKSTIPHLSGTTCPAAQPGLSSTANFPLLPASDAVSFDTSNVKDRQSVDTIDRKEDSQRGVKDRQSVDTVATTETSSLESHIKRYFLGRILLALGGFAAIPVLNRALGVQNYGQLSLWLMFATWIPQILGGWLQQSLLRYHQQYRYTLESAAYRRTIRTLVGALFIATALIGAVLLMVVDPGHASLVENVLVSCLAGAGFFNIVYGAVAQAELKASLVVRADFARTVLPIALIAIPWGLHLPCSRISALVAFLLGLLAADGLLLAGISRRQENSPRVNSLSDDPLQASAALRLSLPESSATSRPFRLTPGIDDAVLRLLAPDEPYGLSPAILRRLLTFGLPMGLWFGLMTGQTLIGRTLLQHSGHTQMLGVYTGFQDFLAKTGSVLFMPVTYALHGQVMALWAVGERQQARETIRRAYRYQAALAAALFLATALALHPLCRFLFGAEFGSRLLVHGPERVPLQMGVLALTLTLAVICGNLGLIAHKGLELGERTGTMAMWMAAATGINLLVSWAMLTRVGPLGAAYGLLAANVFYLVVAHLGSKRQIPAPASLSFVQESRERQVILSKGEAA